MRVSQYDNITLTTLNIRHVARLLMAAVCMTGLLGHVAGAQTPAPSMAGTGSGITLFAEPGTPATNVQFANVTATSLTVTWTPGDGSHRFVLMSTESVVNGTPIDGIHYPANAVFGEGTPFDENTSVVYNGTGASVTVSGLTGGTNYAVAVYEFNAGENGGGENYLITTPALGSTRTNAQDDAAAPTSTTTPTKPPKKAVAQNAVPEPGTLLLLALGLVGMSAKLRQRRSRWCFLGVDPSTFGKQ